MNSQEISAFCVDQLAEILRIPKDTIDVNAKFTRLGLDSAMTVYLLMELEDRLEGVVRQLRGVEAVQADPLATS